MQWCNVILSLVVTTWIAIFWNSPCMHGMIRWQAPQTNNQKIVSMTALQIGANQNLKQKTAPTSAIALYTCAITKMHTLTAPSNNWSTSTINASRHFTLPVEATTHHDDAGAPSSSH